MLKIRQIDHLVLRVIDVHVMMDFYIGVLGWSLEKIQEEIGLYQVRAGSSLIDMIPVSSRLGQVGGAAPGKEGRNLDHFCLRIDPFDTDELIPYLKSKGIDPGKVESRYGAEGRGPRSM